MTHYTASVLIRLNGVDGYGPPHSPPPTDGPSITIADPLSRPGGGEWSVADVNALEGGVNWADVEFDETAVFSDSRLDVVYSIEESGTKSILTRVDPEELDNGRVGWHLETGTPQLIMEEPRTPLSFRLVPTPDTDGTVRIIIVPHPGAMEGCAPIPIPAMFVPYIKYGVMADMFSKEGEASDPQRAAYCEKRYGEGVQLARALLGTEV